MPPETSSFESSSISARTADMALQVPPWEIQPSFTSPHADRGMKEEAGGRRDRITYRGFAVSGWGCESPEECERAWWFGGPAWRCGTAGACKEWQLEIREIGRGQVMTALNARTWGLGFETRKWHRRYESSKQRSSCSVKDRMERQAWGQRDQLGCHCHPLYEQ